MPISVDIDKANRLVFASCSGKISNQDLMQYQQETWVAEDTTGFDGMFDATQGNFDGIIYSELLSFSQNAVAIDRYASTSKMAIIVANENQEQLAEFYISATDMLSGNTRESRIFKDIETAENWLNIQKIAANG